MTRSCGINTVCDASHCPNISDCWSRGHATFLIMGPTCTRSCKFCAVDHGHPSTLDKDEPEKVARAVKSLGLGHVVITSVTRDDLADHGAAHFSSVVKAIKQISPDTRIELLIPDMGGSRKSLEEIVGSGPDVLGHNLETVRRLQRSIRDHRCSYDRSIEVLKTVKNIDAEMLTKCGIILGLGERAEEVFETLDDLRKADVDAITMGQYIKPKGCTLEVAQYITPDAFHQLGETARSMGFKFVASAPLVRSSFNAYEIFPSKEENNAH